MHQISISSCFGIIQGSSVTVTFSTNEEFVCEEMKKAISNYRKNNGDLVVAESVESYFDSHKAVLRNCVTPRFCHNDIHEVHHCA